MESVNMLPLVFFTRQKNIRLTDGLAGGATCHHVSMWSFHGPRGQHLHHTSCCTCASGLSATDSEKENEQK